MRVTSASSSLTLGEQLADGGVDLFRVAGLATLPVPMAHTGS
jgi:hypothetical protein